MNDYYILEGKKAIPCDDGVAWDYWFERADRTVANDTVEDVKVSTVFLGIDHNFGDGEPELFETLVFGGHIDGKMDRYSTWEQAEAGHKAMVERVKQAL